MNHLTNDCIAIDTNVFMHLLNVNDDGSPSAVNNDGHIDEILWRLLDDTIALIMDEDKIANEYEEKIEPILSKESESDRRQLLRYWTLDAPCRTVTLDMKSGLYKAIRKIIHEHEEAVDRAFVYVAFAEGRSLLTNDHLHILFGPTSDKPHPSKKRNRKTRLKADTKKYRPKGVDLMCSEDAHWKLSQNDGDM